MYCAAIVIGRAAQIIKIEDRYFTTRRCYVTVCSEATDPIMNRGRRRSVVNVQELIARKARIESNSEQSTLAGGINRQRYEGRGQQSAILDHSQLACLLANKQAAIGCKGHSRRVRQTTRDERLSKTRRQSGRPCR